MRCYIFIKMYCHYFRVLMKIKFSTYCLPWLILNLIINADPKNKRDALELMIQKQLPFIEH